MAFDKQKYEENLHSPVVLEQWGISTSQRWATIFKGLHLGLVAALTCGLLAYFLLNDSSVTSDRVSGLALVMAIVYGCSIARFFQLKAQKKELPAFRKELARALTGQDEHDMAAQEQVEADFTWQSLFYRNVIRMAGVAGLVLILINGSQLDHVDWGRTIVFDFGIVTYLIGSMWVNFDFKAEFLMVELEERLKAAMQYRADHPEEFEAKDPAEEQETEEEGAESEAAQELPGGVGAEASDDDDAASIDERKTHED